MSGTEAVPWWEGHSERIQAAADRKRVRCSLEGEPAKWGDGRLATPAEVERVFSLKEKEGKSFREIGRELGISKSQAHRIYRSGRRQEDILEGVHA